MKLLKDIKHKRAKQKRKKPIRRSVFNQISGIVKQYGLGENFLDILDKVGVDHPKENVKSTRVRVKTPMESPLFSLVTKDEYALTKSIIKKADNSFLKFAHSPEEILLCRPLYRLNSSLSPEKLRRYHFETLILHELAKEENMRT